jgi:gliding motility-associated-like protein
MIFINLKRSLFGFILMLLSSFSSWACDGMTVNVVSNVYMGNGQYQLTVQFCEEVTNGAGNYGVYGVYLQLNGGATILGTSTPSFTSNANGSVINFNQISGNAAQWGNWDNSPASTLFIPNGSPSQCVTMVLQTQGAATSVNVGGSSHSTNLGNGFTNVTLQGQVQRFACMLNNLPVPAAVCNSNWTPPTLCPNSTTPFNLNTTTSLTGTFSGPGVNPATGILDPTGLTFPIQVTFTVGDAQFNCSTTHTIEAYDYVMPPINDATICSGETVNFNATIPNNSCEFTLYLIDTGNNGWTNSANVRVFVNGVQVGGNHSVPTSGGNQSNYSLTLPVNNGDVITLNYTSGNGFLGIGNNNGNNTVQIINAQGTVIFNQNNPSSGNLGGGITVNCNNPAITYAWTPDGQNTPSITVSPTQTTTYTVTATIGAVGCILTESATVTVSNGNPPSFNPIAPLCQNDAAPALPGTSTNGITGTWSPATISTAAAGTTTYTFTPNPGQCAGPTTLDVTVNPAQVPTFNPLSDVCQNAVVTIPTTSLEGISGTWSPAVNTATAGTTTFTFTPTVSTCTSTTTLSLTVTDLITPTFDPIAPVCIGSPAPVLPTTSTNGVQGFWSDVVNTATAGTFNFTFTPNDPSCTNGTQISVTVNPLPIVNAGTDQTVCLGDDVTLAASGAVTYVWDNGATDGVSFTPSLGTTTYTVTGTDANGCQNTDQVDVTAVDLPVVDAGPDQVICIGESVTLTATGATSYVWDNGATQGGSVSPTTTTTYTVVGTAGTCQDDDQITVTVNPLPIVTANGTTPLCIGETTVLTGGGATTYVWDNNVVDGVAFEPQATATYTVLGTDANGCENTASIQIVVNPLPAINAGIDQTVCVGDQVTLSGSNGVTYAWDNGITNGVAFTPAWGTITYTVIGTDANGCENTDQVDVTAVDLPVVDAGADVAICIGESVTLNATGATTYVWDNGATQGGTVSPTVTTTYTVLGTAGSCQDDDQVTITVNSLPIVTANGTTPLCIGETTILIGGGATTYVWDNNVVDGVAFAPQATATYTVTGTDANGCENTASIQIVVNPLPAINAGIDQTVCIGDQVTLSGSNGVTYGWDNGITNGVAFTPALGTITYTVIGTDANGCENTDQVDVTVVALPQVNAGTDVSICIGESVTLTATGATSYVWDNAATQGGTVSPTVTTTYTVMGTAGSCQDDDQITVTVNPLPIITAVSPNPICIGGTVTLNGQGGVTYVWDNNVIDGVPFSPQTTGVYTVTGTDVNGCENTGTATVNVNPLPIINAGLDISVCPGAEFVLNGSGGTSYGWNNGAVNGVPMSVNNTTVFTVTGTDINGCQNTDQVTVTVLPIPAVNAGPDFTICDGESATLNGSGAPNLAWDNGVQQNVPFTPLTTTTYTLFGVDNNGCVNQDQVTVTVSPIPVVAFIPDVTNGCGPLDVTFTVQSAPGVSCVWDFGDGTNGLGCGTVTHTYDGVGCFDVSMTTTSLDGCVGTITYTDLICLVARPVAEFVATPMNLSMNNSVSQMENQSVGAVAYTWNFGDGSAQTNEVNPSHTFPFEEAGSYEVMLIAENEIGCTDTAYQIIQVAEDIIFYVPNTFTPDDDQFNQTFKPIFTAGFDPYDYNLKIFNRWGELIFESNNVEVGWNGSYGNVADKVQDGTYVWKIEFKQSMNDKRRFEVGHVTIIR